MSMFDKYKIFHGLPKPGQKVTYKNPTQYSFHQNKITDEKELLELGKEYTVRKVQLNSSSTYVYLEEFWVEGLDEYRNKQKSFEMHAFEWEIPAIDMEDLIGFDVRDACRLINKPYEYGIKYQGELMYEGSPVLVLEGDDHDIITKAYFEQ